MKYVAYLPNTDKINGIVIYFGYGNLGKLDVATAHNEIRLAIGGLYASQNFGIVFPNGLGYENTT